MNARDHDRHNQAVAAVDPLESDIGRLRAGKLEKKRAR
jgi:hypothetical protein